MTLRKHKTAWKFLRLVDGEIVSDYDKSPWIVGKWRKEKPPTEACVGLNASEYITDALRYVQGDVLAQVEYKGAVISSDDKVTCESMRILKAWKWDKVASVKLAILAARRVLGLFEKRYPTDERPRKAIEAAEAWVKDPSAAAANAAYAADADAAYAAYADAAYAARAAARAAAAVYADAAADAYAAARAAARAADAAYADARAAARAADAAYADADDNYKAQLQAQIRKEIVPVLEEIKRGKL